MTSGQTAYITPAFSPSDALVCRSIQLRPSLWAVVFNELQRLGQEWQWHQDDPAHATVQEVISEIISATDAAVFRGCKMLADVYNIARDPAAWELVCDGTTYNRVDYPDLYAVIRAEYIIDADSFQVPDLIGRTTRGALIPGTEGGSDQVTIGITHLPPHGHAYLAPQTDLLVVVPGEVPGSSGIGNPSITENTGGGNPLTITNPYHTLIPVILAAYPEAS